MIEKLSDSEKAAALRAIIQFHQGRQLGPETFLAFCETTITTPMEFCILNPNRDSILLFERPASDPVFGGQLHVSGCVMLPGEAPETVWPRLHTSKKYGLENCIFSAPIKIGVIDTLMGPQEKGRCPRGQEKNTIHVVISSERMQTDKGMWHSLHHLPRKGPERLIGHHQRFVDKILAPWLCLHGVKID